MSVKIGNTEVEILYVGLAPRTIPDEQGSKPEGNIYTISKDNLEIYGRPFVTLISGKTYKFIINCPGYPFYITTDSQGGGAVKNPPLSFIGAIDITPESTGEKGNIGIEKGELTWTPSSDHTQMKLFYQCNYYRNMGNEIIVKDGF